MTTIIRGARILTLDAADTEHAKADILVEGATITAIGTDLSASGEAVIDATGLIAMPGLINGALPFAGQPDGGQHSQPAARAVHAV